MMTTRHPNVTQDLDYLVDEIFVQLGNTLVLATPLAAGKANHIINAIYQRAKVDRSIKLTIATALTLEKPKGKTLLEKRFLDPFVNRVYGDYPDLDYENDRVNQCLPKNIQVIEFYFPAGKFLNNQRAQQDYMSTNYTHVARDILDRGVNLLVQSVSPSESGDHLSLSCNPDTSLDLMSLMQERKENEGQPCLVVGQVNPQLPYMYGDAEIESKAFDYILDNTDYYHKMFSTPKSAIPDREHLIGIYLSTLIRDRGELQVGIGALGDAFVNALILRQKDNPTYQSILESLEVEAKFGHIIKKTGDTRPFSRGLFGATEMVVDGFMHLYDAGILKRVVYDDLPIQRLIYDDQINETVTSRTLELLLEKKAIHSFISKDDFDYLVRFGIFKENLNYEKASIITSDGTHITPDLNVAEEKKKIIDLCLGPQLKNGALVHGGFFLGPQSFYERLKQMPPEERQLFSMRSVRRINHLYGHEEIDRLQRRNARFVNSCMKVTLLGSVISDALEDGRVVSGVGGQYNFVAMAQELPDGRSLINLRATRQAGGRTESNIVWNYGHTTIPRHLRDIVVTEYGIANLRGKTDAEVCQEILKITDSRFQEGLIRQAIEAGKLARDFRLDKRYQQNTPEELKRKVSIFKQKGLFPAFPFGTDFTEEELILAQALNSLKRKTGSRWMKIKTIITAIRFTTIPHEIAPYLKRMQLSEVKGWEERLARRLLIIELKAIVQKV